MRVQNGKSEEDRTLLDEELTTTETDNALKQMKNSKLSGID